MGKSTHQIDVYLEIGKKRVFSGAIDWPGWCRSGRDQASALQALFDYAPRYARVLRAAKDEFLAPLNISALVVIEQLEGNATTDFGAPAIAPKSDARPVNDTELRRLQSLIDDAWLAFDGAVRQAAGKELCKGPRGGGRDLDGIVQHVLGAEASYIGQIGGKLKRGDVSDPDEEKRWTRQAVPEALASAVRGEMPERGPRGGLRWTPRYFARRFIWHVLDHAWEIEDRMITDR